MIFARVSSSAALSDTAAQLARLAQEKGVRVAVNAETGTPVAAAVPSCRSAVTAAV